MEVAPPPPVWPLPLPVGVGVGLLPGGVGVGLSPTVPNGLPPLMVISGGGLVPINNTQYNVIQDHAILDTLGLC